MKSCRPYPQILLIHSSSIYIDMLVHHFHQLHTKKKTTSSMKLYEKMQNIGTDDTRGLSEMVDCGGG